MQHKGTAFDLASHRVEVAKEDLDADFILPADLLQKNRFIQPKHS